MDSHQRATVLSFKGLAFNLGYGLVSLAFAGALRTLRGGNAGGNVRADVAVAARVAVPDARVLAVGFWRKRAALERIPAAGR